MTRELSDAVVVVTGASSGIGRATALEFAREGAAVVVTARRRDALESVVRACEGLGTRAIAVPADVTSAEDVEQVAARAREVFGRVDVWVNNAAVMAYGPFEEIPSDVTHRVVETNLVGCVNGSRAAIRQFRGQGEGVLINVASVLGRAPGGYAAVYSATKHAIIGLSDALRQELYDAPGIQVSSILPATIDTPLYGHAANYMGRRPRPPGPRYDSRLVARTIVRAARRPRRQIVAGELAIGLVLLRSIAPPIYERFVTRALPAEQFSDLPAAPTRGNLFEPSDDHASESGGWGETARAPWPISRSRGLALALGAAVAGGVLAGRARAIPGFGHRGRRRRRR